MAPEPCESTAHAETDDAPALAPPSAPTWAEIQVTLLSPDAPVTERYRALFHSRTVAPSKSSAAELLLESLPLQQESVLLRHEFAYVLGQLGDTAATATVRKILHDESENEIVRHEAAEALAALGENALVDELDKLGKETACESLRHTCELAVAGLRKDLAAGEKPKICMCQYTSQDPGSGWPGATEEHVPAAAAALANTSLPLYERYEGLFTLRNVGGVKAGEALADSLLNDRSSAVLRHEIAFVLGQMEAAASIDALVASLGAVAEHGMVRHEAAIALGAVGTLEADEALRAFVKDSDRLVAESCEVALQTSAYWRAWEECEARIAAGS